MFYRLIAQILSIWVIAVTWVIRSLKGKWSKRWRKRWRKRKIRTSENYPRIDYCWSFFIHKGRFGKDFGKDFRKGWRKMKWTPIVRQKTFGVHFSFTLRDKFSGDNSNNMGLAGAGGHLHHHRTKSLLYSVDHICLVGIKMYWFLVRHELFILLLW